MADVLYRVTGGRTKRLRDMGDDTHADVVYAEVAPATGSEIGVRVRAVDALVTAMQRPANQIPYSINDSVSDFATAGSVTALTCTVTDTIDVPVTITEMLIDTDDTAIGNGVILRAHLFNSDPTLSSGVVNGDNAAWSNKRAGWFAALSGTMRLFSDGGRGRLIPEVGTSIIAKPGAGTRLIWVQYQTLSAFTASGNATTITGRVRGIQNRA